MGVTNRLPAIVRRLERRGAARRLHGGVGERPDASRPSGSDTLPAIRHIVVLMMENHSFDNYFGVLGRGDGLPLDSSGKPKAALPDGTGQYIHSFPMPTTCQVKGLPSQAWNASHRSLGNGDNSGFVEACG